MTVAIASFVRGSICIPAFERDTAPSGSGDEEDPAGEGRDRPPVYEEDYNYESKSWKILPDFVDRVRHTVKIYI